MKTIKRSLFLLAAVAVVWGCAPEPDNMRLLDQLVVSTNYDPEAAFKNYSTYAISTDTIGRVSNTSKETIYVYNNPPKFTYPRSVINAVRSQMDSLGYNPVDRSEDPDVGMNIYVVENLNLFQQVYYPYYYSSYYGYGGYYYYPYVQTYAYNTGTLVVEMVDLRNRDASNKVKIVWTAYMGDVMNSLGTEKPSVSAIKTAFRQSPYLH